MSILEPSASATAYSSYTSSGAGTRYLDAAEPTPTAFYTPGQHNSDYERSENDDDDQADEEYDDEEDYYSSYEQQQIDYAELQRQDAEYEAQILEQQDMYLQPTTTTGPTIGITGSRSSDSKPVYYQGPPAPPESIVDRRGLALGLILDAAAVTEQQRKQQQQGRGAAQESRPSLPSILSWADDADECLFQDRNIRNHNDNSDGSESEDLSPQDSDFFNISSTSTSSPTKSLRSGGLNASFSHTPSDSSVLRQQHFLNSLDEEEEALKKQPTPTTVTTYCNYGYFPQDHEFLDMEDQRYQVAEDKWREATAWCERHQEAVKMSTECRHVAVKLLIDEAYRLEKQHVIAQHGPASPMVTRVTTAWRKIGAAAMAEMKVVTSPSHRHQQQTDSPTRVHNPQHQQEVYDPSQNVIRKFSSMAIFINTNQKKKQKSHSSSDTDEPRVYCENEEAKFNRLEAQARVLDSLIFAGRLFCCPDDLVE